MGPSRVSAFFQAGDLKMDAPVGREGPGSFPSPLDQLNRTDGVRHAGAEPLVAGPVVYDFAQESPGTTFERQPDDAFALVMASQGLCVAGLEHRLQRRNLGLEIILIHYA